MKKRNLFFPLYNFSNYLLSRQKVSNGIAASWTVQGSSQSGEEKRNRAETFTVHKGSSKKRLFLWFHHVHGAKSTSNLNPDERMARGITVQKKTNQAELLLCSCWKWFSLWKSGIGRGWRPVVTLSTVSKDGAGCTCLS